MEAEKDFSGNGMGERTVIEIKNGVARHPLWRMKEPIELEIKRGEQVAVVGDNAAGKSRLIEVLTGHYPLLLNEVHYDFSPSRLRLASENMKYITFRDSYDEQDGAYYYQQRWNQHDIADDKSHIAPHDAHGEDAHQHDPAPLEIDVSVLCIAAAVFSFVEPTTVSKRICWNLNCAAKVSLV